jgi:hypothetical protein
LESEWLDDNSLPVLLARAQIEALRTAGNPEERYRAKWLLVRGLHDLGYNAQQVREIFRLIDWMMHLRIDLPLEEICGPIPESTGKRIRDFAVAELKQLGKDLLRFKSLADLEQ